jgi:hypothetical protein
MGGSGLSQRQHELQRRCVPQRALLGREREIRIQQIQIETRAAGFLDGGIGRRIHCRHLGRLCASRKTLFAPDVNVLPPALGGRELAEVERLDPKTLLETRLNPAR